MRINFVTVCSRPQNLRWIETSIYQAGSPADWDIRWYIVLDGSKVKEDDLDFGIRNRGPKRPIFTVPSVDRGAAGARNRAFREIDDGYIAVLDDDNIVHPHFYPLMNTLQQYKEHVFVGHQVFYNGVIRLLGNPENMKRCSVDSASIVWHRNLAVDLPWQVGNYECDGTFVEQLKARYPDRFVYTNAVISYYNALQNSR